jgi:hypothetical protein
VCADAAGSEQDFVDSLVSNGWNVEWISILEGNSSGTAPNQTDAASWASMYGLDPASVWYDASQEWYTQAVYSGVPTIYNVHTTNMLIWDRADGWTLQSDWESSDPTFLDWWHDILDWCDSQSGS